MRKWIAFLLVVIGTALMVTACSSGRRGGKEEIEKSCIGLCELLTN